MNEAERAAVLEKIRAAAKAGNIRYAGRQAELDYLRAAIPKETDDEVRARMQVRLEYVEARTDAEMMAEMGSPEQNVEAKQ